ncbi:MAG: hypothetical protein GXO18_04815 [Aquificae bacterium]|nr:hypothetical protein [Aquificota bacterium]
MKKTVLALCITGTLTLSGFSQAGTLSDADKDFLFGSQSVQAKTISIEEMKVTKREWLWLFAPLPLMLSVYYTWTTWDGKKYIWDVSILM